MILGLRDGLVPVSEQRLAVDSGRFVVVHVQPKARIRNAWQHVSGNVWRTPWAFWFDGVACDAWSVHVQGQAALVRTTSSANCTTNPNTWFYDIATLSAPAPDGYMGTPRTPDGTEALDGQPWLYAHMGAGGDPNAGASAVGVDLNFAPLQCALPRLGADMLSGAGNFATWASGAPAGVTVTGTVEPGTAPPVGNFSLDLISSASSAAVPAYATLSPTLEPGINYSVGFYYFTPADTPAAITANLRVQAKSSNYYERLGREQTSDTTGLDLAPTRGVWRYASFVFRALGGGARELRLALRNSSGSVTGRVRFAGLRVCVVWSVPKHHGRLMAPLTREESCDSPWFGDKRVGLGQISLHNMDGAFDAPSGLLDWVGAALRIDDVGRADVRDQVAVSDRLTLANAVVQAPTISDATCALSITDQRLLIYEQRATPRRYTADAFPNADERIYSRERPVLVGTDKHLTPYRIDKTDGGLGVWEFVDCDDWGSGVVGAAPDRPALVVMYADEDAASRADESLRTEIGLDHITPDLVTGRFTATQALKPFPVDETTQWVSFTRNGTTYHARVLAGSEQEVELTVATHVSGFQFFGAPSMVSALNGEGGGVARSSSTSSAENLLTTLTTMPASATIVKVRLVVVLSPESPFYGEEGMGTLKAVYWNGAALVVGAEWIETGNRGEYAADLLLDSGSPWTTANVNAYQWGVRYEPTSDYLRVDRLRAIVTYYSQTPPSASAPGVRTPYQVARTVTVAIQLAAGASDVSCSWANDTGNPTTAFRFSFAKTGGGTFTLLTQSGRTPSFFSVAGFDTGQDQTGALSYVAAQPYYDPEADIDTPVLRLDTTGYRDDAVGTYTGRADSPIVLAVDALPFLLVSVFGLDPGSIDFASFRAARQTRTAEVTVSLGSETQVRDVLQAFERSLLADVVVLPSTDSTAGLVTLRPYTGTATGTESLVESNRIADWRVEGVALGDLRQSVAVIYVGERNDDSRSRASAATKLIHGTTARTEVRTYVRLGSDAQALADAWLTLLSSARYLASFRALGALMHAHVGDLIRVNRVRGGGVIGGRPAAALMRVFELRHDDSAGVSTVRAVFLQEA